MFLTYYQAIKIFLENKFDEQDIIIPNSVDMDKLAYVFGNYCYEDFSKSVEEQFYDYFDLQNINWDEIGDKVENRCDGVY